MRRLIAHHVKTAVVVAAVLTTAALMLLVRLPLLLGAQDDTVTVEEHDGVYDLTGAMEAPDAVVRLERPATYYPGVLLPPDAPGSAVPESTDRFAELDARYLSQRFRIVVPDTAETYWLRFTLSGRHAMRAYVNGDLIAQSGRLGTSEDDTEVWENNLVGYAVATDGVMDVVLHSAQFSYDNRAATLADLTMERTSARTTPRMSGEITGFMVMSALACAGVVLLFVHGLQRGSRATVYFAVSCFVMALREGLQSQAWVYLPVLPGRVSFMLEYLSVVLLTVFLALYLAESLTSRFFRVVKYVVLGGAAAYGAVVLLGDPQLYTGPPLRYYQALLVVCIVPALVGLFTTRPTLSKSEAVALYGILVFYLAAVSDILMYNNMLGDVSPKTPVAELAMMVFVLAQTVSLFEQNIQQIAEGQRAEQRLVAEKAALENLNRMKTEFLGNISHELKTPLTVVSSNIQYVRERLPQGEELADAGRVMRLVEGETSRMALMVSQLLDVSRIDEGRMSLDLREESLVQIVQVTLDEYYPAFSKNHNTLTFHADKDVPQVRCDRGRITQVLVNLITNAVRHTRHGAIDVSVTAADGEVLVAVRDTGEGIAAERIPLLFERYHSSRPGSPGRDADPAGGSSDTGTGLGLYICKHLVEAHGGTIAVASELGTGTTTTFTIRASAPG